MKDTKIYYIGKSQEEKLLNNLSEDERRIHRINKYGIELERGSSRNRVKVTNGKKIRENKKRSYKYDEEKVRRIANERRKRREECQQDNRKYKTRKGKKSNRQIKR